jgi:organic radical activating enzyme
MNKPKITKYIHAIQPGNVCNLGCEYCYVSAKTTGARDKNTSFNYPLEQIAKAISKERLGGYAFITYVGGGETILPKQSLQLIKLFLEEGHFLNNIVSNMTLRPQLEELLAFPKELLERVSFTISMHWLELKKKNLLDVFFENINKLKENNITFHANMCVSPKEIPHMEEVKTICLEKMGLLPNIGFAHDAKSGWKLYSSITPEDIACIEKLFDMPQAKSSKHNIYDDLAKDFCYIGDWGFIFNLETGTISACFDSPTMQNIVKDISKPIKFEAIGCCSTSHCTMGPAFQTFGFVPKYDKFIPTYYDFYTDRVFKGSQYENFANYKLSAANKEYSSIKKCWIKLKARAWQIKRALKNKRRDLKEKWKNLKK